MSHIEVHFCSKCIVVGFYVKKQTDSGNPPNILSYKNKINLFEKGCILCLIKKKKKCWFNIDNNGDIMRKNLRLGFEECFK